ncbi:PilZ domain-containing protein [Microvirga makkahensis]|uniref:PilZ domain-containing protein n=1 Tax=Microvirga makkahensis TaxID=1128670 RepID=A0A7X3MTU9_9HYPH|nr:PilZ domain-containing protein [Microvirga makkahensis]MXQ12990.1 hypothetical protein [Microvirga makkahensis]
MKPAEQRRASPRLHTLLKGQIIYDNRLSRMECTVRDLSEAGARLVFAQPVKIPAEFELQVPRKKLVQRAQVMWYDGRNYGIRFLDDDAEAGGHVEPLPVAREISGVPEILEEACQRVARILGVPVEAIQLKIEFRR